MEKINFGYSTKNVLFPSRQSYTKSLVGKTQCLIKRIRWKAFFFDNLQPDEVKTNSFGFKTEKSPPQINELLYFENDMYSIVKNIQFKESRLSQF